MVGTPSTGRTGIGVLLKMSADFPGTSFAIVANVTQISAGGVTVNMVDATHLNSPDFYQEFIPALKSSAEWTATIQWDPTDPTHNLTTGLKAVQEARTKRTFQVDPSQIGLSLGFEADCFVSNLGNVEIAPENLMTQQVTLRPSGAVRAKSFP